MNSIAENVRRPVILLAEDEAIIAIELADSLTDAGFDVAGPFSTCSEAEAWLKTGKPDAALLDNLLKDGPCDALASDLSRRGIPVIMFSGHDEPPAASLTGWRGSWVTKPVAFPVLLDALRREMGAQT